MLHTKDASSVNDFHYLNILSRQFLSGRYVFPDLLNLPIVTNSKELET